MPKVFVFVSILVLRYDFLGIPPAENLPAWRWETFGSTLPATKVGWHDVTRFQATQQSKKMLHRGAKRCFFFSPVGGAKQGTSIVGNKGGEEPTPWIINCAQVTQVPISASCSGQWWCSYWPIVIDHGYDVDGQVNQHHQGLTHSHILRVNLHPNPNAAEQTKRRTAGLIYH